MNLTIPGIHHVTAIAGDAQRNLDFYTGSLGLRLVKLTINYDAPDTYHFYYGDGQGRPGTILTFFPWPGAAPGRNGTGQTTTVSFSVPPDSLDYWLSRLSERGVATRGPYVRLGEPAIKFEDPDGLSLEMVGNADPDPSAVWEMSPVPAMAAIRGFSGVTLSEAGYERTAAMLTGILGFRLVSEAGNQFRYETGEGGPGARVDVDCVSEGSLGRIAVGTVHHVAWRVADDEAQQFWLQDLRRRGSNVSAVRDRTYFHSIYFHEPGGVLFEIATDPPGFTVDESTETLGSKLVLPSWFESQRGVIEATLPRVTLPKVEA